VKEVTLRDHFLRERTDRWVRRAIRKTETNRMKLVFLLIWFLSTTEKFLSYVAQKFLGGIETNFITFPLTPNVDVYHIVAFLVTSLALLYLNYVYRKSRQYGIIRYSVWTISIFLIGFFTLCIVNNIIVMERLM
jgi:hypothetical protein